jgi:hypothetical protein
MQRDLRLHGATLIGLTPFGLYSAAGRKNELKMDSQMPNSHSKGDDALSRT